ncbi:GNAT family N-acetyltransferase [Tunturiibacter lichenicola]|uniref:GNAT family N-acetyltransferase n=1 Tax=Tunturiibacter lichenicola TaxID=2051959 RepID=UPI0021B424A7|nr:GNAT family N-acetyltransferase [Edaphobacter lichenicola]
MTVATQLEILDLRHFSARQLRPLLETESRIWDQRLRWNYQSSTELLLQYLDSRILPGFVALDRGRICGFAFCVYEGQKAVVGDAFAVANDPTQALQITQTLLHHLLQLLQNSPGIQRIESQLLLYDTGSINSPFVAAGFSMYPRLFMEYDLRLAPGFTVTKTGDQHESKLPSQFELTRWSIDFYQAAAELIHECYLGHIDARINDQYCSLHGSLRFLHNIVRFPGCGVFDPNASWVLRDRHTGALVGMLLCSRVSSNVGHITQLCIAPAHRGHGLGRTLLGHCIRHLASLNFAAITLTVTEANHQAVKLYEDLGFFTRHRFDAMVLDKS